MIKSKKMMDKRNENIRKYIYIKVNYKNVKINLFIVKMTIL